MDAKFYIKNLINSSKQNSGEGNQNQEGNQTETDPIKIYLDELATKEIQNGALYLDIINPEALPSTLLSKESYITILQNIQANISSENKIGDENNNEFVIIEYPDNAEDYAGVMNELYEASKYIFINEENAIYFLNKFVKVSTKQFMKSVLYSMNFDSANDLFDGLDINVKNFEEKIAINNFKFVIPADLMSNNKSIIVDDIDLQTFYLLKGISQIKAVFDENEDKIIFNFITDTYGTYNEYRSISFKFSNDESNTIITTNINGTNYKTIQVHSD